jgi:hypothetical protein
MDGIELYELPVPPPLFASREVALPRLVWREDRWDAAVVGEPALAGWRSSRQPVCDGVRQLAVVVWARTKLLQRTLADQAPAGSPLLACLARIDATIAVMTERLDALEDLLPRPAV